MTFVSLQGKQCSIKSPHLYRVNWDGPSLSKFQFAVKQWLRKKWCGHIVFEELPVVGTKYSLDFYNSSVRVAVEVQGAQHFQPNKFFHGHSKLAFSDQLRRDTLKSDYCNKNGIRLVEIYPKDVLDEDLYKELKI